MTKSEFIAELRIALAGELQENEIENNIYYYDNYIKEQTLNQSEESVLEQLGDPRLIAKTIIETYQLSHESFYNTRRHADYDEDFDGNLNREKETQEAYKEDGMYNQGNGSFHVYGDYQIKWYHKLILAVVVVLVLTVVLFIGGILLKLFFTIGIPLLVIYLIYRLITNNRN
ncbi:DUF1700 domain-containing protein [Anaerocolumna xylanovorans]|uniref:DUF1700 domain-containing protein n=1 Tax=Anaerocolumna xylanovorans DSM 12503 TaxID=1121345 RepID=A0A1M7YNJ1_9FIRM|nr:DUF1700 domain-containing protein [Anaerocolumna xylanovorans]SHO54128.1 Protein of unknown function [Anaerocolumna xylanovorans DSM 12503]